RGCNCALRPRRATYRSRRPGREEKRMNYFNPGGKEMPAAVVEPAGEPTVQLPRVLVPGGFGDDWIGVSRDLIERFIEVACLEHALPRSARRADRKSTRLNSSHVKTTYVVIWLKKEKRNMEAIYSNP